MNLRLSIALAMGLSTTVLANSVVWCAESSDSAAPIPAAATAGPTPPGEPPPPAGEDVGEAKGGRDLLTLIVRDMRASEQLIRQRQVTAETQRLQQDILGGLAKLIDQYKRAENATPQQSTSRPSRAERNAPTPGEPRASAEAGDPKSRIPSGDTPALEKELVSEVWGQLPEELQRQIQSPVHEQFLPEYEQLIIEYYKRLAEDKRR